MCPQHILLYKPNRSAAHEWEITAMFLRAVIDTRHLIQTVRAGFHRDAARRRYRSRAVGNGNAAEKHTAHHLFSICYFPGKWFWICVIGSFKKIITGLRGFFVIKNSRLSVMRWSMSGCPHHATKRPADSSLQSVNDHNPIVQSTNTGKSQYYVCSEESTGASCLDLVTWCFVTKVQVVWWTPPQFFY